MTPKGMHWLALLIFCALPLAAWASDLDGDGVPDDQDECPQTKVGVRVGRNGCPLLGLAEPEPQALPAVTCAPAPKGALKDANGCAMDEDGDGVPDGLDRCPHTTKGLSVDAQGCVIRAAAPAAKKITASKGRRKIVEPLPPLPEEASPIVMMSDPVTPHQVIEPPPPPVPAPAPVMPPEPAEKPVVMESKTTPASAPISEAPLATTKETAPTLPVLPPKQFTAFIVFAVGRSELNATAFKVLDEVLHELSAKPEAKLKIQATVSRSGDGRNPESVALSRLEIVRVYLLSKGLDTTRIEVRTRAAASAKEARRVSLELSSP